MSLYRTESAFRQIDGWYLVRQISTAVCLLAACSASAGADDIGPTTITATPTYLAPYSDAVTGWNCGGMTVDEGCDGTGWFVSPGADVYSEDIYERPTVQTFDSGTPPVSEEYYGYIDLVSGQYGYDETYMYFQLNLFSPYLYKEDGTVDTGQFGSGTYYSVQIGTVTTYDVNGNPIVDPNTPLLLRDISADLDSSTAVYEAKETEGYFDTDDDVGGTGVSIPDEDGGTGYEDKLIQDGYFEFDGDKYYLLYSRSFVNPDGTVSVELAFNYVLYNDLCSESLSCTTLDPTYLPYLVFDAANGLKNNSDFLWNDEYSEIEAGSPYGIATQNIYKLDNMRVGYIELPPGSEVPEPGTLLLLGGGLVGLAARMRRRSRHSQQA